MANKDLKKLSRLELVDIIYTLQLNNEEKDAEIKKLKTQLENARLDFSDPVAETALSFDQIMKDTMAVTEEYLHSVKNINTELEEMREEAQKKNDLLLKTARDIAFETIRKAKIKANEIVNNAEKDAEEKYNAFENKVLRLVKARRELNDILKGKDFNAKN